MGDQYILRAVSGGAVHETELTAEQALKLSACQAVAYFPRGHDDHGGLGLAAKPGERFGAQL